MLLTLPLVGLLLAFPGIPGLPGLSKIRLPRKPAAALDSLPPAWKPASRLALEDRFVIAGLPPLGQGVVGFKLGYDPRRLRVRLDPDSGTVSVAAEVGNVELGGSPRVPLSQFSQETRRSTFQRMWTEKSRSSINNRAGIPGTPTPAASGPFHVEFPSPLPERIKGILGPGNPSITVTGSENIRLSGTSDWTNQQVGLLGQRRSLFPSLDMQQDLDIRLEGRLSDRVGVNLFQNSANQIPLANRIAINYKGDEDDLVQALDLGNTNLSLPGTQYVSYSGKNEGLFGMKATTRLGPLDFTILASKQEGRSERASYAGGSSRQNQALRDMDYVQGVYFFLYDPNREGWKETPDNTIQLYLDDGQYDRVQTNFVRGRAFVDPLTAVFGSSGDTTGVTPSVRGNFHLLTQGADRDYEVLPNIYGPLFKVIRLRSPVTVGEQRLAVSYAFRSAGAPSTTPLTPVGGSMRVDTDGDSALTLKLIRVPPGLLVARDNKFIVDTLFNATRELALKNFYALAGQRIDEKTFVLNVRKGDVQPPQVSFLQAGVPIPYMEAVGLDSWDETSGSPTPGHDQRVDGTALSNGVTSLVDFANGVLFFPDLRPFAPRLDRPFERTIDSLLFRRARLDGPALAENEANAAIYDNQNLLGHDRTYTIDMEFTAARAGGVITLGRSNIIEGSDVVSVNGRQWQRDKDYRIDYDLGQVTLITQLGAADQLSIDYSYAPLFQQAGKTLLGSAFRWEGRDRNFGGAFLYESKGAQDLRPRLGEEPSRVLIGDLNSEWRFRPEWVTRMVDALPGVRTTAGSEFNVSAEMGASFPNPNTRNEVFIDDMEGVRDAVSLSMSAERWRWSSLPAPTPGGLDTSATRNTEIRWFTPVSAVKERDLKPGLSDAQGAQNSRQVLAISLPRRPDSPAATTPLWAGLSYVLDAQGVDITRSQFLELWVNDFRDFHDPAAQVPRVRGRGVRLHVDIGVVSEDQMRSPDVPPNGKLDTEDKIPLDQQLQVTDERNEDTGMDGLLDPDSGRVLNLSTASASDPEGDDFDLPDKRFTDLDPRKWRLTNGTEGNKNVRPVIDTEDLNANQRRDPEQDYLEYVVALDSTTFLVDEAFGATFANDGRVVPQDNGWRRFRIPLADFRHRVGSPNLKFARHVRVWLDRIVETDPPPLPDPPGDEEGDGRPFLMLGGIDIVGSRWLLAESDTATSRARTAAALNAVNTVDDPEIYRPNFDPGRTRSGSQELQRREQSIELEFTRMTDSSRVEAFRTFSLDENYSRYGALRWIVSGFLAPGGGAGGDSLTYFMRFASDEKGLNYYEYQARVPTRREPNVNDLPWQDVTLTLTDISNLKLNADFPKTTADILYSAPGRQPNETYVIRGRPSFTRIRRVSFGVDGVEADSGRLWLNELRATDVAKDPDRAQRLSVNGRLANLIGYTLTYNGRGADFQQVGETRGSGSQNDDISFGGNFDLHRFFEATGIVLPITFHYTGTRLSPRFTAGDDVVRTGALAEASETRTSSRSYAVSYNRTWSERANPFLRYTVGGVSANLTRSESFNRNPVTVDTSRSLGANVSYGIAPRRLLEIPLPRTKARLYPLPEQFFWNYAVGTSESRIYDRQRDSTGRLVLRSDNAGRTGTIHFGASTRPFDVLHHSFEATRNLTLAEPLREQIGFINLGRVVRWSQTMDARYSVQKLGSWLRPTLSWNAGYNQNNGPELSPDLRLRAIGNTQQMSVTWDVPFGSVSAARNPALQDTTKRAPPPVWRGWIARLGTLSTEAQFNRASSHSRVAGSPGFPYLVGWSADPGFRTDSTGRMRAEFGNRSEESVDWRTAARATRIDLGLGAYVSSRAEYNARRTQSSGVLNRTNRIQFPQLDVEYGRVAEAIGLKRLLTNPRLKTNYIRTQTVDFANNSPVATSIITSGEWRPLLSLIGDFKSGWRSDLRLERRATRNENRLIGQSVTTERYTDVTLSLNRSYSQGQKVNFMGKETTVKSSVTMGLTANYSRQSGETRQAGQQPSNPTETDKLQANANGSYGFSNNVTGNLEVGFAQNRNLQTRITTRSIRLELRAQFTF
jgi:motility/secretion related protein SprA